MIFKNFHNVNITELAMAEKDWFYGAAELLASSDMGSCGVSWYSDNTDVATVITTNGCIYAKAPGNAKIYAIANGGSGRCICINLTVTEKSIEVHPTSCSLPKGGTYSLCAGVYPAYATNRRVVWESADPSIAAVDNYGTVRGVGEGSTLIWAHTADGSDRSACCKVSVYISASSENAESASAP